MSARLLLRKLDTVSEVPGSMDMLRAAIVQLGLRGDFTTDVRDQAETQPLSAEEIASGMTSLLAGRPRYRWKAARTGGSFIPDAPAGWTRVSLNDTGLFVNGLAFKPTDWGSEGRPIIRIQNLSGKSSDHNFTRREVPADNVVRDGDLLVSWSATLDTYVWCGEEAVLNQHIFKVIPNLAAVTSAFLYWLLKHEVRQLAQSQHAHGLAMAHINRGPFLAHQVLLPPLKEQQQIADRINELTALCDELDAAQTDREARRDRLRATSLQSLTALGGSTEHTEFFLRNSPRMISRPEHVAGVRQAIQDLAVQGRLVRQDPMDEPAGELLDQVAALADCPTSREPSDRGTVDTALELPAGWVQARMSQLFKVTGGMQKQPKRTPQKNAWPYVGVRNVQRGRLDLRTVDRFELFAGELERLRLEPGDLLVVEGNGSPTEIGRCARWSGEIANCVHQNHIIRVRPLLKDLDRFALLFLNSPLGMATMRKLAITTAGLYSLSVGKIQRITMPLPPLAEQRRIVGKVDELMVVCDELEFSLVNQQSQRARLLKALLRDAVGDAASTRERERLAP